MEKGTEHAMATGVIKVLEEVTPLTLNMLSMVYHI